MYRKDANFYEGMNSDYTSDLIDSDMNVKLTGIISELNLESGYMKVRVGEEYQYYNFKFEQKQSKEALKNNTIFLSKGSLKITPAYKLENNILIEFIGKWHIGEDLNLNYYTDK